MGKKNEADIQSSRSNPHIHSQSYICIFSRRKRAWKMNIYSVIQGNGDIHRIIQTRVDSILLRAKRKKRSCQLPTFRLLTAFCSEQREKKEAVNYLLSGLTGKRRR